MTLKERPLRFYEQINSGSNVNFMLDFECDKSISQDILIDAFKLVKQRHPYFRMRISTDPGPIVKFVPETDLDENINIEKFDLSSMEQLEDWQTRLIKIGTNPAYSSSLVRLELYSFEDRRYQLYGCVNHAGIDGPGLFQMIRDLTAYLDSILSGEQPKVESKEFYDIHGNYEHSYDLDELKTEPVVTEIFESVKSSDSSSDWNKESSETVTCISNFFQMDEATTKNLITECKKYNVTIQSILSTATMLAQLNNKNLPETPATFFNSCPCCMRPYVSPLKHDDIVCGSAALIWPYRINLSDSFWTVAQQTKDSIRDCIANKSAFKWWVKLANSIPTQPYSIMSSSMGIVSLNDDSFRNLRLKDMRFLGSAYSLGSTACGVMTHAFTFKNRFTMNFSFTFPILSESWGQTFSGNMWRVLELAANGKLDEKTCLKDVIDKMEKHRKQ